MRRIIDSVLFFGGTGLLVWALFSTGKEYFFLFMSGAALLLCLFTLVGLRLAASRLLQRPSPPTNTFALLGGVAGLVAGGLIGGNADFGNWLFACFNPDTPLESQAILVGAVGGGLAGAFCLALVGGITQLLISRSKQNESPGASDKPVPDIPGDAA